MAYQTGTDSAGNSFAEFDFPGNTLRVTRVANSWAQGGGLRVQKRDGSGHLHRGPEIPIESAPELMRAIAEMLLA